MQEVINDWLKKRVKWVQFDLCFVIYAKETYWIYCKYQLNLLSSLNRANTG